MNIWVEYWKKEDRISLNNHAQIREQAKWIEPNPEDIRKRFFDDRVSASKFAQRMTDDGYHSRVKEDRSL
jgi:hypothetical protein